MGVFLQRRWKQQPPGPVDVSGESPLVRNLKHLYVASYDQIDLVTRKVFETSATVPPVRYASFGIGKDVVSTTYKAVPTTIPPAVGWTIAVVVSPTATLSAEGSIIGIAEAPGSGTFDRQLRTVGQNWTGHLYDGATRYVTSTKSVTDSVRKPAHIVVSATASLLSIWVRDVLGTLYSSLAVSNSGYTGYTAPDFCVGYSSNGGTATPDITVLMAAMIHEPWNDAKAYSFLDHPWQFVQPMRQRLYANVAAAGARPRLIGGRLVGRGLTLGGLVS